MIQINIYNDPNFLKFTMEDNITDNKNLCKNCAKELKNAEEFAGLCESCWQESKEKVNNTNDFHEDKNKSASNNKYSKALQEENKVAITVKVIAIIGGIIGILYGLNLRDSVYTEELGATIVIASIFSSVFIYGFGEIIQKLQNIEDNTRKHR